MQSQRFELVLYETVKPADRVVNPKMVKSKGDIFFEIYLGFLIIVILAIIIHFIRKFIKKRKETEEEREIREKRELEKRQKREERINRLFYGLTYFAGILLLLSGIFVFLYQCLRWLKTGIWLEMPLWKLLAYMDESENIFDAVKTYYEGWKGIQKIALWSIEQSSALVMTIIGFIVTIIGALKRA